MPDVSAGTSFPLREAVRAMLAAMRRWGRASNPDDDMRYTPLPYPGLRYFTPETSEVFVGREDQAREMLERLGRSQIVLILGGSGCGKSSLVRGGVLPLLSTTGPVPGRHGAWYPVTFRPEKRAIERLKTAFREDFLDKASKRLGPERFTGLLALSAKGAKGAKDPTEATLDEILADTTGPTHPGIADLQQLVGTIERGLTSDPGAPEPNLLLVVDQFEELFRKEVDRDQRRRLVALIRYVFEFKPPGVFLVLVMRSEDLHRCAEEPGLPEIVNTSFLFVDWLDQMVRAIIEPARRTLHSWLPMLPLSEDKNAPFDELVVKALAKDAETLKNTLEHKGDHLPLLQHGLQVLWRTSEFHWRAAVERAEAESRDLHPTELQVDHGILQAAVQNAREFVLAQNPDDSQDRTDLQWLLAAEAERALQVAKRAFASKAGDRLVVPPALALQAAFCEMASLDENRRYYRAFRTAAEIVEARFPPDTPDKQLLAREALEGALKEFDQYGLLSRGESGWDVTHEALIRNWTRLSNWVREDVTMQRAVGEAVANGRVSSEQANILRPVFGWGRLPIYPPFWVRRAALVASERAVVDFSDANQRRLRRSYVRARLQPFAFVGILGFLLCAVPAGAYWSVRQSAAIGRASFSSEVMSVYGLTTNLFSADYQRQGIGQRAAELWAAGEIWSSATKRRSSMSKADIASIRSELLVTERVLDSAIRRLFGGMFAIRAATDVNTGDKANCEEVPEQSQQVNVVAGDRRIVIGAADQNSQLAPIWLEARRNGKWNRTALVSGGPLQQRTVPPKTAACISQDGEILVIAQPGQPIIQIYRLGWFRGSEQEPDEGASASEIEVLPVVFQNLIPSPEKRMVDVTHVSGRSTGIRRVRFSLKSMPGSFEATFYEGYSAPVRRKEVPNDVKRVDCSKLPAVTRSDDSGTEPLTRCRFTLDRAVVYNSVFPGPPSASQKQTTINLLQVSFDASTLTSSGEDSEHTERVQVSYFGPPIEKAWITSNHQELYLWDSHDAWMLRIDDIVSLKGMLLQIARERDKEPKAEWSQICRMKECADMFKKATFK